MRLYDPEVALLGGDTGLAFYERFSGNLEFLLKPDSWVFFEMGLNMTEALVRLFQPTLLSDVIIHQDLSQRERIMILHYKGKNT